MELVCGVADFVTLLRESTPSLERYLPVCAFVPFTTAYITLYVVFHHPWSLPLG